VLACSEKGGLMVKLASTLYSVAILLPIISFIFGLLIAVDPYFFVPTFTSKKTSLWGDPAKQPGLIIFTIKSDGGLTANYPIDVEVEISKAKDVESYFLQAEKIEIVIPDSYKYPITQGKTGMFAAGSIPISLQDAKGSGKIIFPDAGAFAIYTIFVDDQPVFVANFPEPVEDPIFVVENYGLRLQIENNRNLGLAIISVSLTSIGLLLGLRTRKHGTEVSEKLPSSKRSKRRAR